MINPSSMLQYLKKHDYKFYSGVPCSILKGVFKAALADEQLKYIPAVRENAALGVASGAYLSGKKSCILIQNSGLGNIVNALTSFNMIYKIPILIFVTWRGFKGNDAPEHIIMGEKMASLMKELGIPYRVLTLKYRRDIDWALDKMAKTSFPVMLIVKDGLIA